MIPFALLLASTILVTLPLSVEAAVGCNGTHNPCSDLLGEGSKCQDGFCTNPLQGGCLRALLASPEYKDKYGDNSSEKVQALKRRVMSKPRVCNSDDGPGVKEAGLCVPSESENGYREQRIYAQDWEASISLSWIMQIIFSELLGVPSSIETGSRDDNANFYDVSNRMGYGTGDDYRVFENAYKAEGGDCTVYRKSQDDGGRNYKPCANIAMDVWYPHRWSPAVDSGASEAAKLLGVIGVDDWHITQSSVERDPSLLSHYGLSGEENRRKLAETFKRPTTWKQYCTLVSSNNCSLDDGVAKRPPAEDGSEDGKFFLEGEYTGYFRPTEKNDCDANPNCTGHFVDYPCGWTSYFKQQAYHLGIALESDGPEPSGGYEYDSMVQIWFAANATKSDVIGMWWEPEATFSLLIGSGSDLTRVSLPIPTEECIDNRVNVSKSCDPDLSAAEMYGSSYGTCANLNINTAKIAASNLQSSIENHPSPKARLSPAYEVYDDFTTSTAVVDEILLNWVRKGVDKYGFDLRFATCQWVADNLELISKSFIPMSHPQSLVIAKNFALTVVAMILGLIAILITSGSMVGIVYKKKKMTLKASAQVDFLLLLIIGTLMASVGGLLLGFPPSKGTCTASVWLINIGYTTQIVPSLIRVAAINKVVRASKKMKIVRVNKKQLLRRSIGLSSLAAIYCILWTVFDMPQSHSTLQVTEDQNDLGETVVLVSQYCDSKSDVWQYVSFVWQAILLICGSILAYQMRQAPNVVNDSKELALMIYTSFFFLAFRFAMFAVSESLSDESGSLKAPLQKSRGIFISLDTFATILIFFAQYFVTVEKARKSFHGMQHFMNNIARREEEHTTSISVSATLFTPPHKSNLAESANSSCRASSINLDNTFIAEDAPLVDTIKVKAIVEDKMFDVPKWVVEEYLPKHIWEENGLVVDGSDEDESEVKELEGRGANNNENSAQNVPTLSNDIMDSGPKEESAHKVNVDKRSSRPTLLSRLALLSKLSLDVEVESEHDTEE